MDISEGQETLALRLGPGILFHSAEPNRLLRFQQRKMTTHTENSADWGKREEVLWIVRSDAGSVVGRFRPASEGLMALRVRSHAMMCRGPGRLQVEFRQHRQMV